jgi:hypothetical protein
MDGVIGSRLTVHGRHTVPITPSPLLFAHVNRKP